MTGLTVVIWVTDRRLILCVGVFCLHTKQSSYPAMPEVAGRQSISYGFGGVEGGLAGSRFAGVAGGVRVPCRLSL